MDLRNNSQTIPAISIEQMREVDRAMVEDFGISLLQMMENAGRNLAHLARVRFFNGTPNGKRVAVLAGKGGNGGGGLVCARHLHNWGARITVYLSDEPLNMIAEAQHELRTLKRLNIPIHLTGGTHPVILHSDLVIDALIGYGLKGEPSGVISCLVQHYNRSKTPILSLDVPTGLDAETGLAREPTVMAAATLTLALPKTGLMNTLAAKYVGELYLGDIGVPPELYSRPPLNLNVAPIFSNSEILRLT